MTKASAEALNVLTKRVTESFDEVRDFAKRSTRLRQEERCRQLTDNLFAAAAEAVPSGMAP
jgi:hypothetical protein